MLFQQVLKFDDQWWYNLHDSQVETQTCFPWMLTPWTYQAFRNWISITLKPWSLRFICHLIDMLCELWWTPVMLYFWIPTDCSTNIVHRLLDGRNWSHSTSYWYCVDTILTTEVLFRGIEPSYCFCVWVKKRVRSQIFLILCWVPAPSAWIATLATDSRWFN